MFKPSHACLKTKHTHQFYVFIHGISLEGRRREDADQDIYTPVFFLKGLFIKYKQ